MPGKCRGRRISRLNVHGNSHKPTHIHRHNDLNYIFLKRIHVCMYILLFHNNILGNRNDTEQLTNILRKCDIHIHIHTHIHTHAHMHAACFICSYVYCAYV